MAIIKKFIPSEKINSKAIFTNLPGWKFDQGYWQSPEGTNSNFKLASLSDIDLSNIPSNFYKSGIQGLPESLDLEEILFEDEQTLSGWSPAVRTGQYTVYDSLYYLFSSEHFCDIVDDLIDENSIVYLPDGDPDTRSIRSKYILEEVPHASKPISIEYLQRDNKTYAISAFSKFLQVGQFRGLRSNGIESNGDIYSHTDQTQDEFKVLKSNDETEIGLPILLDDNFTITEGVGYLSLDHSPIIEWQVKFSRPDIFRNELPYSEWVNRLYDEDADPLEQGDYAIGYTNTPGEGQGVVVWLDVSTYLDYGNISYKPDYPGYILFNKDVRLSMEDMFGDASPITLGVATDTEEGQIFYLPRFPALDLTTFDDGEAIGGMALDTSSISVYVDDIEWTRVADLYDVEAEDDQQVFEFNSLWGEIRFGNGGLPISNPLYGARPDGVVTASWTNVPLIRYDREGNNGLFIDPSEDLDPLTNSLKQGFLVLDNRRLIPYKIQLATDAPGILREDGTCCHGKLVNEEVIALSVPPGGQEDIVILRARVIARGNPPEGVPNIPIQFISRDGLIMFTQAFAITDGDGYAYTEAFGKSSFDQFVYKIFFYQPLNVNAAIFLNPSRDILTPEFTPLDPIINDSGAVVGFDWEGDGADWENNVLIVEERVENEASEIYLLIHSMTAEGDPANYNGISLNPDEDIFPYNAIKRTGGIKTVWSAEVEGAQQIIHPIATEVISATQTKLIFNRNLPLPYVNPLGPRNLIMGYQVVIDRVADIEVQTVEQPFLVSNQLDLCLSLNETMKGMWTLPRLQSPEWDGFQDTEPDQLDLHSSRISTATYLNPNDIEVTELENSVGATIVSGQVGSEVNIKGTSFPTTEELYVSVFIIKLADDGSIDAVKNISDSVTFIDSETIQIAEIPSPPGDVPGDYYIAVGGYSETTSTAFAYIL